MDFDLQTIIAKVNEIVVEGFEVEPSLLQPEARLMEDLELDSLDGVDLVVAIERAFSCRIDESEARAMKTLKGIYDYVERTCRDATLDSGEPTR